jgi:hypothetical protein
MDRTSRVWFHALEEFTMKRFTGLTLSGTFRFATIAVAEIPVLGLRIAATRWPAWETVPDRPQGVQP